MKENDVLINEKAYKLVLGSMETISGKIRKALYDYVHEMYHASLARTVAYLGLQSDESRQLLNEMPAKIRESVLSYAEKLKKTDSDVLEEVEHILKTSSVSLLSEYQNIEENIALNGEKVAVELFSRFKKEMPVYSDRLNLCIIKFDELDTKLDDIQFKNLIEKIDTQDLVRVLYGTSDEFKNKFLKFYPENQQKLIMEDMDFAGPASDKMCDEARARIIKAAIDIRYDDIDLIE
ncbi:MAG: hypothetical protein J6Y36_01310 [Treponema sp.]|nr:hypothetical protein [Treponema sp.]